MKNAKIWLIGTLATATLAAAWFATRPAAFAQPVTIAPLPPGAAKTGDPAADAKAAIDKALAYLKSKQNKDYTWGEGDICPALTGLCIKAFIQSGVDPDTQFLDKALEALIAFQKATGGIYTQSLAAYNTAIAISALASAPGEEELKEPLKKALEYLKSLQWRDTIQGLPNDEQVKPGDVRGGGWGYGGGKTGRPDMSNVNMAMDALHDAGLPKDSPEYKRVLEFLTHCQNNSETNKDPDGFKSGDDGGSFYSPANKGMSPAGEYTDASGNRMLRSYGSMTYAGLKSMIYAGLSKDDPRVKAAFAWITKNWTMDRNPGMEVADPKAAESGLFYYYHTMARALRAYGQPVITDDKGNQHDWRLELIAKLASLQKPDGSWEGHDKWMESNPQIVTAMAVLALQEVQADLKDHPANAK